MFFSKRNNRRYPRTATCNRVGVHVHTRMWLPHVMTGCHNFSTTDQGLLGFTVAVWQTDKTKEPLPLRTRYCTGEGHVTPCKVCDSCISVGKVTWMCWRAGSRTMEWPVAVTPLRCTWQKHRQEIKWWYWKWQESSLGWREHVTVTTWFCVGVYRQGARM
jgi:hypothetical protein